MFDLRYHVASLAAVFLALIIGILVGVGISSVGDLDKNERRLLNERLADLNDRLDVATARAGDLARSQRAADAFIEQTYPVLMSGLLTGKRVAVVFVGSVDPTVQFIERALKDAGAGAPLRTRAIRVPVDVPALNRLLAGGPALVSRTGRMEARELGRRLAQEFADGGSAPVWKLLAPQLVEERAGNDTKPADAVVVIRSAAPQRGATARLLAGFYAGLASAGIPAVGVETSRATNSAVDAFDTAHLSSVDDVDALLGRLALALLIAGGEPGSYGLKPTARDGVLPPVESLPDRPATGEA